MKNTDIIKNNEELRSSDITHAMFYILSIHNVIFIQDLYSYCYARVDPLNIYSLDIFKQLPGKVGIDINLISKQ